jgi:hypothetical protein
MITRRAHRRNSAAHFRPKLSEIFNAGNLFEIASYDSNQYATLSVLSMVHKYIGSETKGVWLELTKPNSKSLTLNTIKNTSMLLMLDDNEVEEETGGGDWFDSLLCRDFVSKDRLISLLTCSNKPLSREGVLSLQLGLQCGSSSGISLDPAHQPKKACAITEVTQFSGINCAVCTKGELWYCGECKADCFTLKQDSRASELAIYCEGCECDFHKDCWEGCAREGDSSGGSTCGLCSVCCSCHTRCPGCDRTWCGNGADQCTQCEDCGACLELCHNTPISVFFQPNPFV